MATGIDPEGPRTEVTVRCGYVWWTDERGHHVLAPHGSKINMLQEEVDQIVEDVGDHAFIETSDT